MYISGASYLYSCLAICYSVIRSFTTNQITRMSVKRGILFIAIYRAIFSEILSTENRTWPNTFCNYLFSQCLTCFSIVEFVYNLRVSILFVN